MICFVVLNKGHMSLFSEICWHVCWVPVITSHNSGIEFENGSWNFSNNMYTTYKTYMYVVIPYILVFLVIVSNT